MLFDSHCHIDFAEFDVDRTEVICRARNVGVLEIIVPAVSQCSWQKTIEVSTKHRLKLALGLHPIFIEEHQPQHLIELNDLCGEAQPVAIGEIGLDFYHHRLDKQKQIAYFSKQLIIAKQNRLPVIIHCRKAHDECLQLLQEQKLERGGIIHAFSGSIQHAQKYIKLGFLLGFGGMLTFDRSRKLHALAEQIPLSSIALETDAPDMAVVQHRGERNSPEYLPYVAESLAQIKGRTVIDVGQATSSNVAQLLASGKF